MNDVKVSGVPVLWDKCPRGGVSFMGRGNVLGNVYIDEYTDI